MSLQRRHGQSPCAPGHPRPACGLRHCVHTPERQRLTPALSPSPCKEEQDTRCPEVCAQARPGRRDRELQKGGSLASTQRGHVRLRRSRSRPVCGRCGRPAAPLAGSSEHGGQARPPRPRRTLPRGLEDTQNERRRAAARRGLAHLSVGSQEAEGVLPSPQVPGHPGRLSRGRQQAATS